MRTRNLLFFFLIIFLASSSWAANEKKQLQGIKKEIREKKRLITKTTRMENVVTGELAKIDRSLKQKEQTLSSLNHDLRLVDRDLSRTRAEIESVLKDVEAKKVLIRKRLVSMYKAGEVGTTRFLFSSESVPRMMENLRYMRSLLENDRKLLASYNEKIQKLKGLKKQLEREVSRKESLRRSIEVKKREIETDKKTKSTCLVEVREKKKRYIASLRELEANSRRLQSVIEKLEAASRRRYTATKRGKTGRSYGKRGSPPSNSTGFGSQKGRLSLPTKGRIVGSFGRHKHPEFNSYTFSNGISIAAPIGADVRSVYPGKVVFADYFKGYGNMVIVDHGDGFFSLYAHNSKVYKKVGSNVGMGELLASVGDIDSSRGSILYFEIRYQGKPVDPASWIR